MTTPVVMSFPLCPHNVKLFIFLFFDHVLPPFIYLFDYCEFLGGGFFFSLSLSRKGQNEQQQQQIKRNKQLDRF